MPVSAEDKDFVAQFAPHAVDTEGNPLEFARGHGLRVTSGYSGGRGHNTGSMHYQGSPDNPGAIDIDPRSVKSYSQLLADAQAAGFRVLDERTRPKGQAVWTGPHYHLDKKGQKSHPQGMPEADRAFVAQFAPHALPKDANLARRIGQQQIDSLNRVEPPPAPNFMSDLSGGFQNALSGYTRDDLVRNSGGGIGAGLGNIGGSLVDIGGAGLAGAGLGSIIPGVGTAIGGTAGLVTGGAGLGALQEAQRERLAGEQYNPLKLVGAGAIGGITSFPVGGAASTLAKTVLKNAAIDAGINTAGDIGLQAVEKGTLDPRQLDLGRAAQAAGIGAVGGALSGWHAAHGKLAETHPVIAEKLTKGETLTPTETRVIGQVLTPDEVQAMQEGFRQRTVGEPSSIVTQPFDEAKAVRDLGLAKPVEEQLGTDTGLSVIREGRKRDLNPNIEIARDPFYRQPVDEIAPTPEPMAPKKRTTINEVVSSSLGDPALREMPANDILETLGYPVNRITKNRNTLPVGTQYSVKIAGRTHRFQGNESFGDFFQRNGIDGETFSKGAVLKGPDSVNRLMETLPDGEVKARYQQELTEKELEAQAVKENEYLNQEQSKGQRFIDEVKQAESPEQVKDLADAAVKYYSESPAFDDIFTALDETQKRVERTKIIESPRDLASTTNRDLSKAGEAGILNAQGRVMGEQQPVRDLAGIPQKTEPGQLVDSSGRPMDLAAPKRSQVDLSAPKLPQETPGAFTDTINELLKDSGLDWQGVKQLKSELDTRRAQAGELKGTRTEEAKRVRAELKQLNDRWKALPENVREAAGVDFDTETGAGRQRAVDPNTQFTIDQVRQDLDAHSTPLAESLAQAMQKGTKARIKYVGEQTGRSNEAAKLSKGGRAIVETTEFSPTHFGYYNATYGDGARKVPAVFGYNQRGHEVGYYLNKSPKGSMIQQVVSVTDKPAFKGAIPNVAQGAGEFSMTDMLARGPRTERGFVKTSDAIRAIHEQKVAIRQVMENVLMPADAKQTLKKALSAKDFGYDDIQKLRKTMSNPSILAEFCSNMGLS